MTFRNKEVLTSYLRTDAGSADAAVDGSETAVRFKLQPRSNQRFFVHHMTLYIRDGQNGFNADDYGAVSGPLTNGVALGIYSAADDRLIKCLCDGIPIRQNSDWLRISTSALVEDYRGNGDVVQTARLQFDDIGGPLKLRPTEYLAVLVQDDLTGLTGHYFLAKGVVRSA
jgi:hypothetical protein